ncbi:hypothetical protein LLH00_08415 [bacterium]|nr:hypothetical protein [bacterium]
MRGFGSFLFLSILLASSLMAQDKELKGSFGVVIAENFVKFNYTISYLGDSAQPDNLAFRISFDDTKGFNLAGEITEAETQLKNLKNQSLQGKVQRESAASALLLFPKDASFDLKGKTKLYTEIKGYKLKKDFTL